MHTYSPCARNNDRPPPVTWRDVDVAVGNQAGVEPQGTCPRRRQDRALHSSDDRGAQERRYLRLQAPRDCKADVYAILEDLHRGIERGWDTSSKQVPDGIKHSPHTSQMHSAGERTPLQAGMSTEKRKRMKGVSLCASPAGYIPPEGSSVMPNAHHTRGAVDVLQLPEKVAFPSAIDTLRSIEQSATRQSAEQHVAMQESVATARAQPRVGGAWNRSIPISQSGATRPLGRGIRQRRTFLGSQGIRESAPRTWPANTIIACRGIAEHCQSSGSSGH